MQRGEVWWVEFDERRPVVLLSGDYELHADKPGMNFVDTPDQLAAIPDDYAGQIFTTRIDVVGPAMRARRMELQ